MVDTLQDRFERIRMVWASVPNAPVVSLVIVNMIPLLGVIFLRWSVFNILFLYWVENVIIGFYNILRMMYWGMSDPGNFIAASITSAFFLVHYGGFCFGHIMFIIAIFAGGVPDSSGWAGGYTGGEVSNVIHGIISPALLFGIVLAFISHGISFGVNYIWKQEYRNLNLSQLMFAPYKRVFLLHIVIIFGGGLAVMAGNGIGVLALLVIVKTGMDLWGHLSERTRMSITLYAKPFVTNDNEFIKRWLRL